MDEKFSQLKNKLIILNISDSAFRVACYLISCSKNSFSFPSIRTMSEKLHKTSKTINKAIRELEEKNIVLKETRTLGTGKKTSNCYYINEEYIVSKKEKEQVIRQLDEEIRETPAHIELFDYDWLNDPD